MDWVNDKGEELGYWKQDKPKASQISPKIKNFNLTHLMPFNYYSSLNPNSQAGPTTIFHSNTHSYYSYPKSIIVKPKPQCPRKPKDIY